MFIVEMQVVFQFRWKTILLRPRLFLIYNNPLTFVSKLAMSRLKKLRTSTIMNDNLKYLLINL
jgi:hypothetical protein